jgi:hypothetical protein
MPPKKAKAKSAGKVAESSSSKGAKAAAATGNQGASRGAARVNLSSENELRLRRLLLNSGGANQSAPQAEEALTDGQKKQAVKRLKNIYDHLVAEGFTSSQCETALSKLPLVRYTALLNSNFLKIVMVYITWMNSSEDHVFSKNCRSMEMLYATDQVIGNQIDVQGPGL